MVNETPVRPVQAALARFFALAILAGVLSIVRWPERMGTLIAPEAERALALGFLLLASYLAGMLAQTVGLPKITGYLGAGLLFGPEALGLLGRDHIDGLAFVNRLAIGIIAFVAGGELRPAMLRERGRAIAWITVVEMTLVLVAVTAVLLIARAWVPFLEGFTFLPALVLALVFASVATVHSPAVAIAVLDEQRARGPLSSTALGVVVAADVVVVVLVTGMIALAKALVGGDGGLDAAFVGLLSWELIGAVAAGALLGVLVDGYLRLAGAAMLPIFVVFFVFLSAEIAEAIHVEFMLFMLAAGFFVENVSPVDGEPLLDALRRVSTAAYALFFGLAGASIHLGELGALWKIALLIVGVRALALWCGSALGARVAGAEPVVRRLTWLGLVSQAGVALGLAVVASEALGAPGRAMLTLFLAMITIHELVGPILFRWALVRAGEAGRGERETR